MNETNMFDANALAAGLATAKAQAESKAESPAEPKPENSFSSIRTTIDRPPTDAAANTVADTTATRIRAIAPNSDEADPLDQTINLPSNYKELDEATQTRTLLTSSFFSLTSSPSTTALASHTNSQRHLAASLIAAHSLGIRYLDALNRVHKARQDLAEYVDQRAPGGKCTREWRLEEVERLVREVERWYSKARRLREEGGGMILGKGVKGGKGVGLEEMPAGWGAARKARMEGEEGTVAVGGLGMEMAKEWLELKGKGAVVGGAGHMDGGGAGSSAKEESAFGGGHGAGVDAAAKMLPDPWKERAGAPFEDLGKGEAEHAWSGLTEAGMMMREVEGDPGERVAKKMAGSLNAVDQDAVAASQGVEVKAGAGGAVVVSTEQALKEGKLRRKPNKWAKAFGEMDL